MYLSAVRVFNSVSIRPATFPEPLSHADPTFHPGIQLTQAPVRVMPPVLEAVVSR